MSRLALATPFDELAAANVELPPVGAPVSPEDCRALACRLALKGIGRVSPNPLVGSVLVDREHRFLGAGAHLVHGGEHAEVNAIRAAETALPNGGRDIFQGATAYVTLEPCAHVDHQPACAQILVDRGFGRVIYGAVDPDPRVDGRGARILEDHGVEAIHDKTWERDCREVAWVFHKTHAEKRPAIALKAAMSLDGALGTKGAQRQFLTGERARAYGHFLRVYYDAIVIGRRTLELDDPSLDPRDSLVPGRVPWRIVLDPSGATLRTRRASDWRLASKEPERAIWVVSETAEVSPEAAGKAKLLRVPRGPARALALPRLLSDLYGLGIRSLLLEGGAGLYRPFLTAGLVDRVHLFVAPRVLGKDRISWVGEGESLDLELEDARVILLDRDVLLEGIPKKGRSQ